MYPISKLAYFRFSQNQTFHGLVYCQPVFLAGYVHSHARVEIKQYTLSLKLCLQLNEKIRTFEYFINNGTNVYFYSAQILPSLFLT
jgi:hypothetical protein